MLCELQMYYYAITYYVKAWKSVLSCSVVYRAVKGLVTMIDDSSH